MKKVYTLGTITAIHFGISFGLFLIAFSIGMGQLDDGQPLSLCENIITLVSNILLWPIFSPIAIWVGRISHNIFHGLWGYIPLVVNSFVWALVIYWVYSKIKSKKTTNPN
jgi:hypothetical protein